MIIFTGGGYLKTDNHPGEFTTDFKIIEGRKWMKSGRRFALKPIKIAIPKNYQILTDDEAKAQGLM